MKVGGWWQLDNGGHMHPYREAAAEFKKVLQVWVCTAAAIGIHLAWVVCCCAHHLPHLCAAAAPAEQVVWC